MFTSPFQSEVTVPKDCNIVWVQDLFADQYAGGAELTSQALIDACSDKSSIFQIHSDKVTLEILRSGVDKLWVFGTCALDLRTPRKLRIGTDLIETVSTAKYREKVYGQCEIL